jgi:hypothetical protein
MLLNAIPDVRLQYDASLSLLRVAWTGGAGLQTFRMGSMQLVGLAQRLGMQNCLLEMDTLPDLSAYDQIWLGLHWLPEVFQLPLQQVVFTIKPQRVYHQAAIDSLLALARPFIRFDVQFFEQPRAALRWLTQDSAYLPALLAEWEAVISQPELQ